MPATMTPTDPSFLDAASRRWLDEMLGEQLLTAAFAATLAKGKDPDDCFPFASSLNSEICREADEAMRAAIIDALDGVARRYGWTPDGMPS